MANLSLGPVLSEAHQSDSASTGHGDHHGHLGREQEHEHEMKECKTEEMKEC